MYVRVDANGTDATGDQLIKDVTLEIGQQIDKHTRTAPQAGRPESKALVTNPWGFHLW